MKLAVATKALAAEGWKWIEVATGTATACGVWPLTVAVPSVQRFLTHAMNVSETR